MHYNASSDLHEIKFFRTSWIIIIVSNDNRILTGISKYIIILFLIRIAMQLIEHILHRH